MSVTESIWIAANDTLAKIKTWLGGDSLQNEIPVKDPTVDIDADKWNKHAAGVAECAKRLRPGNVVAVEFELASTPASATTPVPLAGSALTEFLAFKDATLIGIAAKFETALTAGQATVQPQIGGTNCNKSLVIAATNQAGRAHQLPGAAGANDALDASTLEALEVDVVTNATFATSGSSKLRVAIFLSIGEEEDV